MIEVTDAMINAVRAYVPAPCSRSTAQRVVETLLAMPEVRAAILTGAATASADDVTEEPQGIGAKVIDRDDDIWERFAGGWVCDSASVGETYWSYVLAYGPLRRVQ